MPIMPTRRTLPGAAAVLAGGAGLRPAPAQAQGAADPTFGRTSFKDGGLFYYYRPKCFRRSSVSRAKASQCAFSAAALFSLRTFSRADSVAAASFLASTM